MSPEAITLHEFPEGKYFEDFIAAYFQCGGFYVERNIEEIDIDQILEFDVIITDYLSEPPKLVLIEAKSKDWKFTDIFKLRGWMDYTNIEHGMLIVCNQKYDIENVNKKFNRLNIEVKCLDDYSKAHEILDLGDAGIDVNSVDAEIWRFSYLVKKALIRRLKDWRKSVQNKKCYNALHDYYYKIQNKIFFTENIVARLDDLYTLFKNYYPRISAKTGNELNGGDFESDVKQIPNDLFIKTFYGCEMNELQVSSFIEFKARMALLKNVVDYILYKRAGDRDRTELIHNFLDHEIPIYDTLPVNLQKAIEELKNHDYVHLYPIFWQWFLWFFGGFILKDYKQEEYELFSNKTGIPVDEIDNALKVYDILFPKENGAWFIDLHNTSIQCVSLTPIPIMAMGVQTRLAYHTEDNDIGHLNEILSGQYTFKDMMKWHGVGFQLLKKYYKELWIKKD